MKQYKFRAWHKEAAKMLFGEPKNVFFWLDEGQPVEVMQYTNMKDKNGVEIYEGDIVKYDGVSGDVEYKGQVSEVKSIEGCLLPFYEAEGYSSGMLYHTELRFDTIKVIGNKWENPEALA